MKQQSDVFFRAEKEYKNSREKFFYLLREIVSNAIHAVLIRKNRENNFIPQVKLNVSYNEDKCEISLWDNGDGFTETNSKYFDLLDKRNPDKEKMNFHPLGQGRLAIVYFSDSAEYESVYKDNNGVYKKKRIPYPNEVNDLFDIESIPADSSDLTDSYTNLKLTIQKNNTLNRAKTFFKKYADIGAIKQWFIETFFPFIANNEQLEISLVYNGNVATIKKALLESEAQKIPFDIELSENSKHSFDLWLIKTNQKLHGDNLIDCFARNLKAELTGSKITYSLDSEEGYRFCLTSKYFDENVDTKGEKIDLNDVDVKKISEKINELLDGHFQSVIQRNQQIIKNNLKKFEKIYPSLETFVDKEKLANVKNVINENDILKMAVDRKSQIERKFWLQDHKDCSNEGEIDFNDSEECQKLLNSSLHIYVKHRERVLNELHHLIQKFNDDGTNKFELENTVHELFFRRGSTLEDSENTNHLHNLWILDDKFTTFSNNFKARSTKNGQSTSDIYIWADDPEKTKQILILELKSTTKAHNAGKHEEGMVAQVKRYASDFLTPPKNI